MGEREMSVGGWHERLLTDRWSSRDGQVRVRRTFHSYSPTVDAFCDLIRRASGGLDDAMFTSCDFDADDDDGGYDLPGVEGWRARSAEDDEPIERERARKEQMERAELAALIAKYPDACEQSS